MVLLGMHVHATLLHIQSLKNVLWMNCSRNIISYSLCQFLLSSQPWHTNPHTAPIKFQQFSFLKQFFLSLINLVNPCCRIFNLNINDFDLLFKFSLLFLQSNQLIIQKVFLVVKDFELFNICFKIIHHFTCS